MLIIINKRRDTHMTPHTHTHTPHRIPGCTGLSERCKTRRPARGEPSERAGYSNATPGRLRAIAISTTGSHTFVAGSYLSTELSE